MKRVVWGILGTAKIAREKVIPALQGSEICDVQAVASRSLERAQAYTVALGIPRAYGSYQELFDDPAIEVVYNPLPNHEHVALTLQAARAGKHVLCEKPVALDANQAAQLREVASKVHIMEAFMLRFHPQWNRAREILRSGKLGPVRSLQAWFSYCNMDPNNIRNKFDIGGGALYDIGCYPIVVARYLFDAEPLRVVALIDRDPHLKIDRTVSGLLDFGGGRRMDFTVSTQSVPYQRVTICGEHQRLEVRIPFNAPLGGTTDLLLDDGKLLDGSAITCETIPACNMYSLQGDLFSRVVRGELEPPYGIEDAILNMRVIDALFESERTAGWVNV
ncbi:MAG: Gfo/Idh/MocA family oxidoreductase [Rhodoferax sp.]|nr:Gfo/Idh/MocA family oxidoreductase [Rhodoferax sp.]